MANQTVSVNRNNDDPAISGLLNGEDYTINSGATLTIDSDSRWGQQAAVIGNITIDSGTGGRVLIDARNTWWLPFDASTGNVPALGTVGVQDCTGSTSLATGEFLGVWTALGVAPSTAGGAMPSTGFVKFRSKVGNFLDNEVVNLPGSATVTVNSISGGSRGWIHVVGETATTITVPRLGNFDCLGDWFELGMTDGNDNQTFQYPVADYCPGVEIETGPGTGIFELWPSCGTTRWAQNNRIAQDTRGKVISCTSAGVIQLALRGATSNGYKPPSGCRVRIGNILGSTSSSTNWTLNNLYTTGAKWDWTTTAAGAIKIDKANINWYVNFSQPYSVEVTDSQVQENIGISECATAPVVTRCCVGIATSTDNTPFSFSSNFAGGNVSSCVGFKYENESNDVGWTFTDCDGFTITECKTLNCGDNTATTLNRGSTGTYNVTFTRVTNTNIINHSDIGGGMNLSGCVSVHIAGYQYADCLENRNTNSSNGVDAIIMQGTTANCTVEGPFSNFDGIANVHPYNYIIQFLNAYDCEMREIGSSSSPYNCGSANQCAGAANFAGNDLRNIVRRVYVENTRSGPIATVNNSSLGQAINVWGDYADTTSIAALNFTFRGGRMLGSNSGQTAVYGTHWSDSFTSSISGAIKLHANEPTSFSSTQCQETSGSPLFTSTGQVKLVAIGDQVTWEMPYFALGHNSLTDFVFVGTNVANHLLQFQSDIGSGYSDWLTLNASNLNSVGAIDPSLGIKLKIRATCITPSTSNAITYINIITGTNSTDQQIQYPLPGFSVEITGLVEGSEVRAYLGTDPSTAIEIAGIESSSTSFTFEHTYPGQDGYIVIFALGKLPIRIPLTYAAEEQDLPVQQAIDRQYNNP